MLRRINMDVLIDANIILDVLLQRAPFYENSVKIVEACVKGRATGFVSAHSVTTVWYVLRHEFSIEERRKLFKLIFTWCRIASVGQHELLSALERDDFSDFEDCVQDECAASINAGYIITRNKKDFVNGRIPALLPEEFIGLMESGKT